jgi:hypothetical protein
MVLQVAETVPLTPLLLTAIGTLAAAVVALFWLNVRQRDKADAKYERFMGQMLPLLEQFKSVSERQVSASENLVTIIRSWTTPRTPPPPPGA